MKKARISILVLVTIAGTAPVLAADLPEECRHAPVIVLAPLLVGVMMALSAGHADAEEQLAGVVDELLGLGQVAIPDHGRALALVADGSEDFPSELPFEFPRDYWHVGDVLAESLRGAVNVTQNEIHGHVDSYPIPGGWPSVPGVTAHAADPRSTTLDDVFVHYTGHDLRDALQDRAPRDFSFVMQRGRR